MPSAIECKRNAGQDLNALREYAHTYRGKDWRVRVKNATLAYPDLKQPFFNYGRFFQRPRSLLSTKLRSLAGFLYELYDSKAGPFKYIRELRDYEKFGACAYCGLPKNITVDHYLPRDRSAFPHLSFLSLNLVPACSDCQGSKLNFYPQKPNRLTPAKASRKQLCLELHSKAAARIQKARRTNAQPAPSLRMPGPTPLRPQKPSRIEETRRFIHPYFDGFLRRAIFDVALAWSRGKPEIANFLWKPHLSSAQRALVVFHLRKMKVRDRSRGIIRRRYDAFVKTILGKSLGKDAVVAQLLFKLRNVQSETGMANSIEARCWEAVLRDSAAISRLVVKSAAPKPPPLVKESTAARQAVRHRRRHMRGYIY